MYFSFPPGLPSMQLRERHFNTLCCDQDYPEKKCWDWGKILARDLPKEVQVTVIVVIGQRTKFAHVQENYAYRQTWWPGTYTPRINGAKSMFTAYSTQGQLKPWLILAEGFWDGLIQAAAYLGCESDRINALKRCPRLAEAMNDCCACSVFN